jgi:hypothetical protein
VAGELVVARGLNTTDKDRLSAMRAKPMRQYQRSKARARVQWRSNNVGNLHLCGLIKL